MKSGIYYIKNLINNKTYVGSSCHIEVRVKEHFFYLRKNKHKNIKLQRAFNKYGENNFEVSILEEVEQIKLIPREQYWIDYFNSAGRDTGYNIAPRADRSIMDEDTKDKIRLKHLGRKLGHYSPEWRKNIGDGNRGKKRTEETKLKNSKSHKGNSYALGCKHSLETRMKQSLRNKRLGIKPPSRKGIKASPETITKMRASMLGKNRRPSPRKDKTGVYKKSTIEKMRLARIKYYDKVGRKTKKL